MQKPNKIKISPAAAATKAFKQTAQVHTGPTAFELIQTYLNVLASEAPDKTFTTKDLTAWAVSYCLLTAQQVPAELANSYALGKHLATLNASQVYGFTLVGSYGNRKIYRRDQ